MWCEEFDLYIFFHWEVGNNGSHCVTEASAFHKVCDFLPVSFGVVILFCFDDNQIVSIAAPTLMDDYIWPYIATARRFFLVFFILIVFNVHVLFV